MQLVIYFLVVIVDIGSRLVPFVKILLEPMLLFRMHLVLNGVDLALNNVRFVSMLVNVILESLDVTICLLDLKLRSIVHTELM